MQCQSALAKVVWLTSLKKDDPVTGVIADARLDVVGPWTTIQAPRAISDAVRE